MKVTFNGLTKDLNGHIYDVGIGSQFDPFTATTKTLVSYYWSKCTDPQYTRISIERQKDVIIPIPSIRTDIYKDVARVLVGKYIGAYIKRAQQYLQNKAKIYSVSLGQCTKAMKNSLELEETYKSIKK